MGQRCLIDPFLAPARAAAFRDRLRALRAEEDQDTLIPLRALTELCPQSDRVVVEPGTTVDGNPTPVELFCLGALVRACKARRIFEIGTFDGAATLHFALNSPDDAEIWTLDLPADAADRTHYPVLSQERGYIVKPGSGARFAGTPSAGKIRQLYGDSAVFPLEPHLGRMDLIFVDGSHSLLYVRSDSARALSLARPGGWIVWHDYGVWPDVTTGLHELAVRLPLIHLTGTTLVVGRLPTP